jgi:hypothetical protein
LLDLPTSISFDLINKITITRRKKRKEKEKEKEKVHEWNLQE